MTQNKKRGIVAGVIVLVFILIRFLELDEYITLENVQLFAGRLRQFVANNYALSVMYFEMIMIAATIASVPVTLVLTILSGFLYGAFLGALYSVIGATIGGMILVIAVRYIFGDYFQKKYHDKLVEFNQELDEYGLQYLFFIQVLPFTPTFMLNILVGLSKISVFIFAMTAIFGMFPAAFIYAFAGQEIELLANVRDVIQPWMVNITIILLILFIMFFSWSRFPILPAKLFKKIVKKRKKK